MKNYIKYGMVIILCYLIPFGLFHSCQMVQNGEQEVTQPEISNNQSNRIKMEYHTRINGIDWYILNVDGRNYVGNHAGGLTLITNE